MALNVPKLQASYGKTQLRKRQQVTDHDARRHGNPTIACLILHGIHNMRKAVRVADDPNPSHDPSNGSPRTLDSLGTNSPEPLLQQRRLGTRASRRR